MPSIVGYEGNKNSPWYPLFGDSILRHGVIIRVGINFKSKNPIVVLHFHKIQLRLNVSRIYIAKIRERGIRRKHLLFDKKIRKKKKKDMQQTLRSTKLDCLRRSGMRSP